MQATGARTNEQAMCTLHTTEAHFLPALTTSLPDSVLKPKARTGISKPYNVKQIKTTNAQEAEAAIRCLLEAGGGR